MTAGCGSDSSTPTTPSQPNTVTFSATLLPANEAPAISGPETSGRGTASITFNLTRNSAGAIQSGTVDFHYDLTAFPAGTTITASIPARAAYAADDAAVFPVDAQTSRVTPRSTARVVATDMPRSLHEPVGFAPSHVSQSSWTP